MKLDKKENPVIILLILSGVLILILISILLVVLFYPSSTSNVKENDSYHYGTTNDDGFHLEYHESFSQRFGIGYSLLSDFGLNEYSCTGSCTCEVEGIIRRSTGTMTRNVKYFISAISTVFALNLAKTHFRDHCREEFDDSCSSGAIKSNVESCDISQTSDMSMVGIDSKMPDHKSDFRKAWEKRYKDKIEELSPEEKEQHFSDLESLEISMRERSFNCQGNCMKGEEPSLDKKFYFEDPEGIIPKAKNAFHEMFSEKDCSVHLLEKRIEVSTPSLEFLRAEQSIYENNLSPDNFAMDFFEKMDLHHYCSEMGLRDLYDTFEDEYDLIPGSFDLPPVCLSYIPPHHNPSVHCEEVPV